ncbi:MAG TPA: hypothetical protein IAB55_01990 [Candidatus Merdivicinus faecavium]|nr:hypothetical protein [Candidatus Merdivicinus faecavium]
MKDEEYLFREDVREKAITARSAHKRPRRSGCRMPQYTAKELREMNGPTYTVNLGKPIAYKEFKALSESLQKEYLKDIFAKYNVGMSAVAELLGVPVSTCTSKLHKLGFTFPRGFKPNKEDLERFRADFGLADAPAKKIALRNISICFSGVYDSRLIAQQLKGFDLEGEECRITVVVEVVRPEG